MSALSEAIHHADSVRNPAVVFDLLSEEEVWQHAKSIFSDPDKSSSLGPTLLEAIRSNLDSLEHRDKLHDLLLYVLNLSTADSLVYRTTQRVVIISALKWRPDEANILHTAFEKRYSQALEDNELYVAEIALEGALLLALFTANQGLFYRSVGLLLSHFPTVSSDNADAAYLPVKAIKLLGRCYDYEPGNYSIKQKVENLTLHKNLAVSAEAYFNLGVFHLYDAFLASDSESLQGFLEKAREAFFQAQSAEDNRSDAVLFATIIDCYLLGLKQPKANSDELLAKLKAAESVLSERLTAIPGDLPTKQTDVELGLVRLISQLQRWTNHVARFPAQPLELSLFSLAQAYADISEAQYDTELARLAGVATQKHVMLPSIFSPFVKSREITSRIKAALSDQNWLKMARPSEVAFYRLALDELDRETSDPKVEAAAELEKIRAAAEQEAPELAQSIEKLQKRNLSTSEIYRTLLWQLVDEANPQYINMTAQRIVTKVTSELRGCLDREYPNWRELKYALIYVAHYFHRLYIADANSETEFLFAQPTGLGKTAREANLENHFYKYAKWAASGIECDKQVTNITPGRPDLAFRVGLINFPIEVKQESIEVNLDRIQKRYIAQSQSYAAAVAQVGFLFVLDVTEKPLRIPLKDITDYCYVDSIPIPGTKKPNCICVFIFPGNRHSPSSHSWR